MFTNLGECDTLFERMGNPVPTVEQIRAIHQRRGGFTKKPSVDGPLPMHVEPFVNGQDPLKFVPSVATNLSGSQKRWQIGALLEKHGIHPVEELILMLTGKAKGQGAELTTDQRIKVLTELASYIVPKMKTVEHTGTVDHKVSVNIIKFSDLKQAKAADPVIPVQEVVNV